ncbi:PLK2 [Mytilus edulis]|uniref:PLK2 n=1 Tax=Mytilus edulis TaxID=6550 RepID=A0A8S3QGF8_MYTED|nr:PLK2 [Mytilus edulis]
MVNILRSFVTDECFWPKKKNLAKIHKDLHDSGSINKNDLFQLWNQTPFNEIMPDDDFKEYILQVLIHLDILIEPKRHTEGKSMSNSYLVPCIVKALAPSNFIDKEVIGGRTLCLAYEMTDLSVPSALSFKIIAAALVVWPLKEEDGRPCLYYQSALMNVDERNELRILIEGQRVMVYLTNAESIHLISPDVAASIQECLTLALTNILKFYLQSFGKFTVNLDVSCYFNIKVD